MPHQDEEGFWTIPSGRVASQVRFLMTTNHALSSGMCGREELKDQKEGFIL